MSNPNRASTVLRPAQRGLDRFNSHRQERTTVHWFTWRHLRLKLEETRFKQTLDRGLRLLDDELAKLGEGQPLPGAANRFELAGQIDKLKVHSAARDAGPQPGQRV